MSAQRDEAMGLLVRPCRYCGGEPQTGDVCDRCQRIPDDAWCKLMLVVDLLALGNAPTLAKWAR